MSFGPSSLHFFTPTYGYLPALFVTLRDDRWCGVVWCGVVGWGVVVSFCFGVDFDDIRLCASQSLSWVSKCVYVCVCVCVFAAEKKKKKTVRLLLRALARFCIYHQRRSKFCLKKKNFSATDDHPLRWSGEQTPRKIETQIQNQSFL